MENKNKNNKKLKNFSFNAHATSFSDQDVLIKCLFT